MQRKNNRLFLLLLFFLLVASLLPAAGHTRQDTGEQFLFFYSNDIRGETEPCG
ncbi:hypothetical protein [Desulfolithobacter sp.]